MRIAPTPPAGSGPERLAPVSHSSPTEPPKTAPRPSLPTDTVQAHTYKGGMPLQASSLLGDPPIPYSHMMGLMDEPVALEHPYQKSRLVNYLGDLSRLLSQHPEASHRIANLQGGPQFLSVLAQAEQQQISSHSIRTLQTFLVQSGGIDLSSPGHPTGIDASYGPRTHAGIQHFLTRQLQAFQPQEIAFPGPEQT